MKLRQYCRPDACKDDGHRWLGYESSLRVEYLKMKRHPVERQRYVKQRHSDYLSEKEENVSQQRHQTAGPRDREVGVAMHARWRRRSWSGRGQ